MNESWNLSGIILEGISGTGKTTLLNKLVKSSPFMNDSHLSSIVLTEFHTVRVLEKKHREKGLVLEDSWQLLNRHTTYLEHMNESLEAMEWCRDNQKGMRLPYLFERFHLTHINQYEHLSWSSLKDIDERLRNINCKMVLLISSSEALEERLFKGRDDAWYSYIRKFGDSNKLILDYFVGKQSELIALYEKSILEKVLIDTSHLTIEQAVNKIFDFWDDLS